MAAKQTKVTIAVINKKKISGKAKKSPNKSDDTKPYKGQGR